MKLFLLMIVIVSGFANPPSKNTKSKSRKPSQSPESYFQCRLLNSTQQVPVFKLSIRSPVTEDEIVYRESNRHLNLAVKLMKSGEIFVKLIQGQSHETIATGSTRVDYTQSFSIEIPGQMTKWTLNCDI